MTRFCPYLISLLLLLTVAAHGQGSTAGDTTLSEQPTDPTAPRRKKRGRKKRMLTLEETKARFDPGKAFLYSTILPGAGQFYNKKYWKVPIVLAGLAGGLLLVNMHGNRYYDFKRELYELLRDDTYVPPSGLTEGQLRGNIDQSKRDRDLFAVLTVLWYFLQAVEAHVDAHLRFFKINPRLQVGIEPPIQNPLAGYGGPGLTLTLRF